MQRLAVVQTESTPETGAPAVVELSVDLDTE